LESEEMDMKTYYALVLLSTVIVVGCSRPPAAPTPAEVGMQYTKAGALMSEMTLVDGVYYRKGANIPFTGLAVEFYEDGNRKEESYFAAGKFHGPQIKWYRNGTLFSVAVCEEGAVKYMKEYGPDAVVNK
jgi:antitoxin component YwqK of YwqJK toxin-antitoxin module